MGIVVLFEEVDKLWFFIFLYFTWGCIILPQFTQSAIISKDHLHDCSSLYSFGFLLYISLQNLCAPELSPLMMGWASKITKFVGSGY